MTPTPISAAPEAAVAMGGPFLFWVCAIIAVAGAVGMLVSRKAVHSALFVVMTMISIAVLYISLNAPFLGMVQVIVYTGAIMMLFVFVMMIVGVDASDSLVETLKGQRWLALGTAFAFAALLIIAISNGFGSIAPTGSIEAANAQYGGNVQGLAHLIFTRYVVAFEVTSALLIVAALGAMMLTFRERFAPKVSQEEMSIERFKRDKHPGNLPGAGTYARHNAVDTPALLPDGSVAHESVPNALIDRGSERAVNRADVDEVRTISEGFDYVDGDSVQLDEEEGQ
ncbi:MAG: NADH-quinone oxidoreductase subunit J [Candidatus Nanopelagicales bacterium]